MTSEPVTLDQLRRQLGRWELTEDEKKGVKADYQRHQRKVMSAALSNRKGICLCCGAEFDLKRTSGKTCSDKCRQALRRKGAQLMPEPSSGNPVRNAVISHAPALVLWIDKQPEAFQKKAWVLWRDEARQTLGTKLIAKLRASR